MLGNLAAPYEISRKRGYVCVRIIHLSCFGLQEFPLTILHNRKNFLIFFARKLARLLM